MRLKGKDHTSDFIDYKEAFKTAEELINQKHRMGLLIMIAINTGLRYSDLKVLHDRDIARALNNNNELVIIEQKTGKKRIVYLNKFVIDAYNKYPKIGPLFISQKRSVYDISQVNRVLKKLFRTREKWNISTHSLRKTFARTFYDNAEDKEDSLVMLSQIFNHETTAVTRRYLGITKEEKNAVYKHFESLI